MINSQPEIPNPIGTMRPKFHSTIPQEGIGLCLSGGGYRAMLFHTGVLWRLNEAAFLGKLDQISSVSGGSIIAGLLGLKWSKLAFDEAGVAQSFQAEVVEPIRNLAGETIDASSIIVGALGPGTIGDKVTKAYKRHLFGEATLQDLADAPQFVINATNVQSGVLWRFTKTAMGDYRVGEVENPTVSLAQAVAASSAFPPFLSPVRLKLGAADFVPDSGQDLQQPPYTTDVYLTDGGVYDNLGLEPVWKRYNTMLVSDAGGQLEPDPEPETDWARHSFRTLTLIDSQVRALRKRLVVDAFVQRTKMLAQGVATTDHFFRAFTRKGAYWSIRGNIAKYSLETSLDCPMAKTQKLAETPTRLKELEPILQERLINWGYAMSDAAIRRYVERSLPPPAGFPYPASGVG